MKKNLLVMLFLVVLGISSSLAAWANQQGAADPASDNSAKSAQQPCCAKEGKAAQAAGSAKVKGVECDKCPLKQAGCPKQAGNAKCEKCAKLGTKGPCPLCAKAAKAGKGCDKCPKAKTKPCMKECDKCPKKTAKPSSP